jgi:hypothetical protein
MARSHRRLATIAATGTLAGLATLVAAGSASAATGTAHAAPSGTTNGTVCVVSAAYAPIAVQSGVCTVVVVHEGVLTQLLNDLL